MFVTGIAPIAIAGLFSWLARSKKQDPDEEVLKNLRRAGSDLTKPHKIDFFLYFPTEAEGQDVAVQIRQMGFDVDVRPAAQGPGWLCFATKIMVPTLRSLQETRRNFNTLASARGGEYDGWGTGVVR